ncbi:hypothetical protein GTU79_01190 [Sodalis ligni]|uniref:hypothetical protein n=1 Tax=Sodalis ligni TaxID=2697027 RepID=UPI00193F8DF3|nr:hypothetical protein [Sodalis ligni]QWA11481.1 hypothetical protein GTU79_01190 [Sodalis ligni]
MTISIDYSVAKTPPAVHNGAAGADTGNLAAKLESVKNSPDNVSTFSLTSSLSASAAKLSTRLGLDKLINGLTWVGSLTSSTMGNIVQFSQYAADTVQMVHDGAKIVQYGIEHGIKGLLSEIMVLLKAQSLPIVERWIDKVYEAGKDVTLTQILKILMECIANNQEIKGLFKEIIAT